MKVLSTYCLGRLDWGVVYWIVMVIELKVALAGPPPGGTTGVITIERVKLVRVRHVSGGQVPAKTPVGPGSSRVCGPAAASSAVPKIPSAPALSIGWNPVRKMPAPGPTF